MLSHRALFLPVKNRIFFSGFAYRNLVLAHSVIKHEKYQDVPPTIIIHGLLGSKVNFRSFSKALHSSEIVSVDLRNHGESDHIDSMNMDEMAHDIVETMSKLNHNKFFIVGHSLGGKVAMAVALLHTEKLHGLAVLDMSPQDLNEIDRPTTREGYSSRYILSVMAKIAPRLPKMSKKNIEEAIKKEMPLLTPGLLGFLMQNIQESPTGGCTYKANILQLDKVYDNELRSWDFFGMSTSLPSLFLSGSQSHYVSKKAREEVIPSIFTRAECKVIEGAGHWVHADKPTEVLTELNKFLDVNKYFRECSKDAREGAMCGRQW